MKAFITAAAPRFIMRMFALRDMLQPFKHRDDFHHLLEIGPGLGDVAAWLHQFFRTRKVSLVEISPAARVLLTKRFGSDPAVSILPDFKIDPGNANVVLCFEVLEHLENDTGMLADIYRALAPGGLFIGSVPAFMRKWQHVDEIAGHVRRYEESELTEKMTQAGFRILRMSVYGFPVTNLLYPLRQVYYQHKLQSTEQGSAAVQTQKSGISRGLAKKFNTGLVYALLWPLSLLQLLPFVARWGDGFVFVCQKPES